MAFSVWVLHSLYLASLMSFSHILTNPFIDLVAFGLYFDCEVWDNLESPRATSPMVFFRLLLRVDSRAACVFMKDEFPVVSSISCYLVW